MENKKNNKEITEKLDKKTEENKNLKEKEKKSSNAQKAMPVMITVIVSLAILLLVTLIAFFQLWKTDKQNSKTLETMYTSSYFTMVDGVNNLHVDASKFETVDNKNAQRDLLKSMSQDCQYILGGLQVLPIDAETSVNAIKFFNQISGVCDAYIKSIDEGEVLTEKETALITEISYVLGVVKNRLNQQNAAIIKSGYSFIDASVFNEDGISEFSSSLGDLSAESVDYPVMIFDGPFSASLEKKEILGLSKEIVSQEDAYNYLRNIVYKDRDDVEISYNNDSYGDFDCYNYNVKVGKKTFSASVSQREGKLITLCGYAEEGNPSISDDEVKFLAEGFANRIGFENMTTVWFEVKENICYVNLAPKINNVIMYPDLVKVKVDSFAEEVIGFEAQNYGFNHVDRNIKTSVSKSNAENVLGYDYIIKNTRLCVIPMDNGTESTCYEFELEKIDGMYFYYVNANTGKIVKILKVVESNGIIKTV